MINKAYIATPVVFANNRLELFHPSCIVTHSVNHLEKCCRRCATNKMTEITRVSKVGKN